jgi:Ca2+-binding EF-hand superfamily protein
MKKFKAKLESADKNKDGYVDPQSLSQILTSLRTDLSQIDLDKYIRSLEKDVSGRVNY